MKRPILAWLEAQYRHAFTRTEVAEDYQRCLEKSDGSMLADLSKFCFVRDTTYSPGDPVRQTMNEGRREVFIHLTEMLDIKPDELNPEPVKGQTDDRNARRPPEPESTSGPNAANEPKPTS